MDKMLLYHGSSEIIQKPVHGKGKIYNDYGLGFYCTEHPELAKEWACTENTDGYANQYELNLEGLKVLRLSEYTILHWLTLLLQNRSFQMSTPMMKWGAKWLEDNFLPDIEKYDIIIGYRADDSYFSFAKAFLNNAISLEQLSYAMKLGKLGEQIVLKSPKAFDAISFLSYTIAENAEYYIKRKARDEKARAEFKRELERGGLSGLYIRDIIQEEVRPDDSRLR